MTVFWTADTHFWHRRANELCHRPWSTVEEMNAGLIQRWNSVVTARDQVFLLGDFAFQLGTPGVLNIAQELNGIITLVPGNHDRCHPMTGQVKSLDWRDRYLRSGFADVTGPELLRNVTGRLVKVCHFPYDGDSHDADRFTDWRPADDGTSFLLHGHVHNTWRQRGRQVNVGVDAWNGYPVPEDMVMDLISAGPADLPPIPWQAA